MLSELSLCWDKLHAALNLCKLWIQTVPLFCVRRKRGGKKPLPQLQRELKFTFCLLIMLKSIINLSIPRISHTISCSNLCVGTAESTWEAVQFIWNCCVLVFSFFREADLNNLFLSCPVPLAFYSQLYPLQALPILCFQGQRSLGLCSEMSH